MSETDPAAPLAVLDTMLSKPVTVRTKAGQHVQGTLAGYDEHLNLTLEAGPATDDRDTDEPRDAVANRSTALSQLGPSRAVDDGRQRRNARSPPNSNQGSAAHQPRYRIYPDGTVEGDGLHRKHLEQLLTD